MTSLSAALAQSNDLETVKQLVAQSPEAAHLLATLAILEAEINAYRASIARIDAMLAEVIELKESF